MKLNVQSGQSMTEFIIIAPLMILVVMGSLQFAFIYNAKTTVNYAAFQAARSGAVNHGLRSAVETAFVRNMAALYTNNNTLDAVRVARARVQRDVDDGFVCMQRLNPPTSAFLDHGLPSTGEIPNDNLMFRKPVVGVNSGLSIQDANLLKVRVTYCFSMIVPLVNRTVSAMGTASLTDDDVYGFVSDSTDINIQPAGNFQRQCYNDMRIPIVAHALVRMQSAARPDNSFAETCD